MQSSGSYDVSGRKLFIGLPAYDHKVSVKLAVSLAKLAQAVEAHGVSLVIGSLCGCSVVSRARNLLVQDFFETDCTDLMFIDADISFDHTDVLRLLALGCDAKNAVLAGVPRTRTVEKSYIARLNHDPAMRLTFDSMGLVRAERVATAFMLIRREVLTTLRDEHPEWVAYDPRVGKDISSIFDFKSERSGYVGEDFLFCDRAREHGFEVWIDPTIKLGHMGVQEYMGDFGNEVLYPTLVVPDAA